MKEIKIIQDDNGTVKVETLSDGESLNVTEAGSIDEALEQIKGELGVSEDITTGAPEAEPVDETGPISASKGNTLEDNLPVIDEEKKGMRSKKKADWSDYATM